MVLLAAWGYDCWGVEYSEHAVRAAEEFIGGVEREVEGGGGREEYKTKDEKIGRGVQKCLYGDFFKDEWGKDIPGGIGEGFDLIYDCTVRPPSNSPIPQTPNPFSHIHKIHLFAFI